MFMAPSNTKDYFLSLDLYQVCEDPILVQVREHIETLVEGFLGGSLDSAHVDKPYDDLQCM